MPHLLYLKKEKKNLVKPRVNWLINEFFPNKLPSYVIQICSYSIKVFREIRNTSSKEFIVEIYIWHVLTIVVGGKKKPLISLNLQAYHEVLESCLICYLILKSVLIGS